MDDLTKSASEAGGGVATGAGFDPAALAGLQGAIQQEGGIDGLMAKMRDGGLGPQVDSWVSTGENQPVEPDQLQQALGPDTVQRLSAGSGLNIGQLLPMLAMFLPQIVNMLTPHGTTPQGGVNQAAANSGPDLGGMLGGVLGGLMGGAGGTGGGGQGGMPDLGGLLGGMLGGQSK
jgi:uncharacterized protein YidB (DUF937 family)